MGDNSKDIPVGTPVAIITDEKDDVSLACYMLPSGVTRFCSLVKILRCHASLCHVELMKAHSSLELGAQCHSLPDPGALSCCVL